MGISPNFESLICQNSSGVRTEDAEIVEGLDSIAGGGIFDVFGNFEIPRLHKLFMNNADRGIVQMFERKRCRDTPDFENNADATHTTC